jgi:hypothetical protein
MKWLQNYAITVVLKNAGQHPEQFDTARQHF